MPAKPKAKPRSTRVSTKASDRRRIARATAVPAKPGQGPLSGQSIENAAYYVAGHAAVALAIGEAGAVAISRIGC